MSEKSTLTQNDVAENLLWGLWRCIDDEYKNRYLRDIWDQFENAIRSASYTDSLKVFLTNFIRRIPTAVEVQYSKEMLSIIDSGQDETVLDWMRSETTYLCMLVRLKNQNRKELFKEGLE